MFIAEKIKDCKSKIAGGQPGQEISWQVTGIWQDASANDHRFQVEETKSEAKRGKSIYPVTAKS